MGRMPLFRTSSVVGLVFKRLPPAVRDDTLATVLPVHDEATILDLVRLYLETEGHRVLHAPDAATALTWWEKERPDLVVPDVGLTDMDGFALCRRLRQERQTPICMLTARDETSDRILGQEPGADDYLTKPFHPLEHRGCARLLPAGQAGRCGGAD